MMLFSNQSLHQYFLTTWVVYFLFIWIIHLSYADSILCELSCDGITSWELSAASWFLAQYGLTTIFIHLLKLNIVEYYLWLGLYSNTIFQVFVGSSVNSHDDCKLMTWLNTDGKKFIWSLRLGELYPSECEWIPRRHMFLACGQLWHSRCWLRRCQVSNKTFSRSNTSSF
jgi:hypothetical protein